MLALSLCACAALRDDMKRAESSFEQARYEDVMVWLDELEPSVPDMAQPMRARFYYLRGLTAFRLGQKRRARHYLALCREEAGPEQASLRPEWRTNMASALAELTADPRNPEASPGAAETSGRP